jgi:hypothetical protein
MSEIDNAPARADITPEPPVKWLTGAEMDSWLSVVRLISWLPWSIDQQLRRRPVARATATPRPRRRPHRVAHRHLRNQLTPRLFRLARVGDLDDVQRLVQCAGIAGR